MTITATTLRQMADHIETVGFCKGSFYKGIDPDDDDFVYGDHPCCVLGAAFYVLGYTDIYAPSDVRVSSEIALALGLSEAIGSIPEWNDAPGMGKATVLKKLREAANNLERETNG